MKKKETFGRKSQEYKAAITKFINNYQGYFGEGKAKLIKKMLEENIKKITVHKDLFKEFPLFPLLEGCYLAGIKKLEIAECVDERTLFHEMLHAASTKAQHQRENLVSFYASKIFKNKVASTREFEEGMTEYFSGCMTAFECKSKSYSYDSEQRIVNRLSKIYGDDTIMEYYLGENNRLIDMINHDFDGGFNRILALCRDAAKTDHPPIPFEPTAYCRQKDKEEHDDVLFEIFSKKNMLETNTIDGFKHNLKKLFYFYLEDMECMCDELYMNEKFNSNDSDIDIKKATEQHIKETLYARFDEIMRKEWKKTNIDDDYLYYSCVLDEIKSIHDEFTNSYMIKYLGLWSHKMKQIYEDSQKEMSTNNNQNSNVSIEDLKNIKRLLIEENEVTNKPVQSSGRQM